MAKKDEKLQAYEELTTQMNASTVTLDAEKRQKLHEILHQKPEFAQLLEKFKALCSDDETRKAISEVCPASEADDHFDFKAMLQSMGAYCKIDPDKDGYVFNWPGKQTAIQLANEPTENTLIPDKADSRDWDATQNIYIEGDNLEALKCLRNAYAGKIKMIYIDPPYNADAMTPYCDYFRGKKVSSDDAGKHTKWLNMLYPRLMLARELMSEDGVIFISIDDSEQANIKKICDELYGSENLVNIICVNMSNESGPKINNAIRGIKYPKIKEYLLIYAKNKSSRTYNITIPKRNKETWDEEYNLIIPELTNELRQKLTTVEIEEKNRIIHNLTLCSLNEYMKQKKVVGDDLWKFNNAFRIVASKPNTSLLKKAKERDKFVAQLEYIKNNSGDDKLIRTDFNRETNTARIELLFADDKMQFYYGDHWDDIVTTGGIGQEGGVPFFGGKKPLKLLERVIETIVKQEPMVALDFFSGSSTTAHAVLKFNNSNKLNNKFIMVQLAEDLDKAFELAHTNDEKTKIQQCISYLDNLKPQPKKHNLCEIGKQRIRNAGDQIKADNPLTAKDLDIGFRVFRVGKSNIPKWWAVNDTQRQLDMFDNEEDKRTDEEKYRAIAYEFMLKHKCMLDARVDEFLTPDQMAQTEGKPLFVVDGALFICPVGGVNAGWATSVVALRRSRYAMTSNDAWFVAVNDTLDDSSDNRDSDKLLAVKTLVEAGLPAKHFLHI